MTEKTPEEPLARQSQEDAEPDDELELQDPDESEDLDADGIEQELLDAMKSLRRTNKKVEQYLDGLARDTQKPDQEAAQPETAPEAPKDADAPADPPTE